VGDPCQGLFVSMNMSDWYHIYPDKTYVHVDILTGATKGAAEGALSAFRLRIPRLDGPNAMDRRVGTTEIQGVKISTVFLALDHSYTRHKLTQPDAEGVYYYIERGIKDNTPGNPGYLHVKGPNDPMLWETMIFDGPHHDYQKRTGGTISHARAMHINAVQLVLDSMHNLHVESFPLLHQIVNLGFEPEPKKKFRKVMINKNTAIPAEAIAEKEEMIMFMECYAKSIHQLIGRTNWDRGMYSNRGVVRKGEVDKETHLCRALVGTSMLHHNEVKLSEIEDVRPVVNYSDDINSSWEMYVGDTTPETNVHIGVQVSGQFDNKPFISIRDFPDTLFIRDRVHEKYYRVWGSPQCEDMLILFGKHGYFISLPYENKYEEATVGYTSYAQIVGMDGVDDTAAEIRENLQDAVNPYTWKTVANKIDDYGTAIFQMVNEDLDDPYIDPDSDNSRIPLHFVCGSEAGLDELFNMIMQASLPDEFWNAAGVSSIEIPVHASMDEEEACLSESYDGQYPGIDFIESNESVQNCIEEAMTQNEPQGYYWEYNDGARNKRSGYSANAETVSITVYRPSSHERVVQMKKLEAWCRKYNLPVPTEQTLVPTIKT